MKILPENRRKFKLNKAFLKNKNWSGTSLLKSFSALVLLFEILDNMSIVIICCPACAVIDFEINLSFHIKPFST